MIRERLLQYYVCREQELCREEGNHYAYEQQSTLTEAIAC